MLKVPIDRVKVGMRLGDDLVIKDRKVMDQGAILTAKILKKLKQVGIASLPIASIRSTSKPKETTTTALVEDINTTKDDENKTNIEESDNEINTEVLQRFKLCNTNNQYLRDLIQIINTIETKDTEHSES